MCTAVGDGSFHIAYPDSAMERAGLWGNQRRCAEEVRRAAPRY
jgi:hypothetical protein